MIVNADTLTEDNSLEMFFFMKCIKIAKKKILDKNMNSSKQMKRQKKIVANESVVDVFHFFY